MVAIMFKHFSMDAPSEVAVAGALVVRKLHSGQEKSCDSPL